MGWKFHKVVSFLILDDYWNTEGFIIIISA